MKTIRKITALLAIIVLLPLCPGFADTGESLDRVIGYYRSNRELASWWDMAALWGCGENLRDYILPQWDGSTLRENSTPADYAGIILGLIARGENVHDFYGRDIARELAAMQDKNSGSFGEYVNFQAYSILALDAAKERYDRPLALSYLASLEAPGGGFGFDGKTADIDLTAMALLALSGSDYMDVIERGVDYMARSQLENGGFESWGTENSNTLAGVISALSALNLANDERFIKGGRVLSDVLAEYINSDGSLSWEQGDNEPNQFATQQGLIALCDLSYGGSVFKRLSSEYECAEEKSVNAKVRIEGINKNVLSREVTVNGADPSVLDAIVTALKSESISYDITTSSYGAYIREINGEAAGTFGGWDGWLFLVNGAHASAGADSLPLSENDEIIVYYGMMEPDTLIPRYDLSPGEYEAGKPFTVTVTSTYYDWSKKESVSVTVAGAAVEVGGRKYVTDEKGMARITIEKDGTYTVRISKDNPGSYPSIIRTEPFEIVVKKSESASVVFYDEIEEDTKPQTENISKNEKKDEPSSISLPYRDAESISDWARAEVSRVTAAGIFKGDGENCFNPQKPITRAEFAAVTARLIGAENKQPLMQFHDVKETDWYYNSVAALCGLKIMTGTGNNYFSPNDLITREQAATVIFRALGYKPEKEYYYNDFSEISGWAIMAVNAVTELKIMQGSERQWRPKEAMTREMCAVIASRILDYKAVK